MNRIERDGVVIFDHAPQFEDVREAVLTGLGKSPKSLPSKLFYDARGSELFERITELPEYYPTRTEIGILRAHGAAMAEAIGAKARVVELGSGASVKTRILLDELEQPAVYVPIDISTEALAGAAAALTRDYPDVAVLPVCADFSSEITLPEPPIEYGRTVVFFPGSTIGNLTRDESVAMLRRMRAIAGSSGCLLVGFDQDKDPAELERAYDDASGVTAEFNRNVLVRIRDELGAEVDVDAFAHRAVYVADPCRIEMHLVSRVEQAMVVDGHRFEFAAGETIVTEYSHKYTRDSVAAIASGAGLRVAHWWTDDDERFAVVMFEPE